MILIAVGLIVVAWVLSFVVRLALSRSREFLADAGSVELTKNPDAMISALRKIEGRGELPGATSAVMELCVDNPREGFGELFDTHPTVDSRVAALIKFAGGHDPGPIALPPSAGCRPAAGRHRRDCRTVQPARPARGATTPEPRPQLRPPISRSCRPRRQSNSAAAISHLYLARGDRSREPDRDCAVTALWSPQIAQ